MQNVLKLSAIVGTACYSGRATTGAVSACHSYSCCICRSIRKILNYFLSELAGTCRKRTQSVKRAMASSATGCLGSARSNRSVIRGIALEKQDVQLERERQRAPEALEAERGKSRYAFPAVRLFYTPSVVSFSLCLFLSLSSFYRCRVYRFSLFFEVGVTTMAANYPRKSLPPIPQVRTTSLFLPDVSLALSISVSVFSPETPRLCSRNLSLTSIIAALLPLERLCDRSV